MSNSRKHPLDIDTHDSNANKFVRTNEESQEYQAHPEELAPLHIYIDNFEVITDNNINMMFHVYGNLNQLRYALPLTQLLSQYQLTIRCNNMTFLLDAAYNYTIGYHFNQGTLYYNNQPIQIVSANLLDFNFNLNYQNLITAEATPEKHNQNHVKADFNNTTMSGPILLPQQYPRNTVPYFYADNWEIILDDEATSYIAKLSSHKRTYRGRPVTIFSNFLNNHRFTAYNKENNTAYILPVINNKEIKHNKIDNTYTYHNDLIIEFEKREIKHKKNYIPKIPKKPKKIYTLFEQASTPNSAPTLSPQEEIKTIMENYEKCLTDLSSHDNSEEIENMKSHFEAIKQLYETYLMTQKNNNLSPKFN